jgi:hypothetical protein
MMKEKIELLLEGSYLYYKNEVNFSQENFKLVQLPEQGQFHVYAEILSRLETGDFLKLLIRYEMTNQFIPYFVSIQKSVGNKSAKETYKCDHHTQELRYSFETPDSTQELKKSHNSKHYLTSPAFSTAAMWTLSKKMDATGRTALTVMSSSNEWNYQGPPSEKIIYSKFKSRELIDYKLNNTSLNAAHLCLFEEDSSHTSSENVVDLYISKHFAIPYQLVHGDLKINILKLKKHT